MTQPSKLPSWFGPGLLEPRLEYNHYPEEFDRLWRAFMTARATLGLMLVLLQGGVFLVTPQQSSHPWMVCVAYFCVAVWVRLMAKPSSLGHTFDVQWLRTVGVDLLVFSVLQASQTSSINYTPLFALPVLTASILGSLIIALGTSAGITLLLFGYAAWVSVQTPWDTTAQFVQAALTGAGCFAIAFLTSQLASRLASVELRAQRSQWAAALQRQVNELVIESLSDGIAVVDERFQLRSVNPAALAALGLGAKPTADVPCFLTQQPGWLELLEVVRLSHLTQCPQQQDVVIQYVGKGQRHLRVQTQLTKPLEVEANPLCVVFLRDQREMQARLRTERLASMGRVSAAVAHEIRNPLAAIVQANALLAEELENPDQLRLTQMVQQNAQRLEKTVHDILHLARANTQEEAVAGGMLDLKQNVIRISRDWLSQFEVSDVLSMTLAQEDCLVWFDSEHLRRVLVNLLDNAHRFASGQPGSIQINVSAHTGTTPQRSLMCLQVWSDGGPLDPSVEQHLFEPFFSSDSRSTGLGLYICRELCQSHAANMSYDRAYRFVNRARTSGNEFNVMFCTEPPVATSVSRQTSALS